MSVPNTAERARILPTHRALSVGGVLYVSCRTETAIAGWLAAVGREDGETRTVLREVRNRVLGHDALRRFLVQRHALVARIAPLLRPGVAVPLQREAAVILGSVAYGGGAELEALLASGVPQMLLETFKRTVAGARGAEERRLCEAAVRTLRTIYRQRGTPRELPFAPEYLPALIECLVGGEEGERVREYCAVMLANCCDGREKQLALGERGAVAACLRMATGKGAAYTCVEAALDLLAALTRENAENAQTVVGMALNAAMTPVTFLFDLLGRRGRVETRVFAAVCLANLCRTGVLAQPAGELDPRIAKLLVPSLASLMEEKSVGRARAAEVLALLLSDSEQLQVTACTSEVVGRLAEMLGRARGEEEREAALLAFAALASFKEECRRMVIEAKILPLVVRAMESASEGVRSAACQCTRSLSRSVKNLRTALVDAGMVSPLLALLSDASLLVQKTACAALCNLVLDFSPMKEAVLREGGVARLVELVESPEADLRLNALWALKNLLYLAETEIKTATMEKITYERLAALTMDPEPLVQEQTLNLIRNLVCEKEQDIAEVLARFGETRLIALIESKLSSPYDEIVLHSCYVIANACTATSIAPKNAVMASPAILDKISHLLAPGQNHDLQLAALWCVINLTWTADTGSAERVRLLRRRGVEKQLEVLRAAGLVGDVRDRVQTALNNFSALDPPRNGARAASNATPAGSPI